MIIEKTLEYESEKIKISDIENFIKSKNITPIRYFITEKRGNKFIINVSGIN